MDADGAGEFREPRVSNGELLRWGSVLIVVICLGLAAVLLACQPVPSKDCGPECVGGVGPYVTTTPQFAGQGLTTAGED